LGLHLVKRIAELHGARVQVQSQVGHGSTFSVYFPKTPT
jgi:signal transduction histidine kinase